MYYLGSGFGGRFEVPLQLYEKHKTL